MSETNDPINNENIEKENVTNTNNDNDNNSNNKQDSIKDDYKKEVIEQNGENQQTNQENLKNSIESLKGRIIASAKLLKYAESSRTEIETERSKVTKVNKQLEQQKAEYLSLEEALKAERAKNTELKETITQLEKNQTTIVNMQNELKMITEQKLDIEKHLSGREMYINQLEAEIKNMDTQLKSKEKRRDDKLLEKKDKLIKDLQNQLKSLQKKYETAEEDKMETNIHYEMLQRDYEEKSQQLNQLKIDLQNNKNNDQKEPMSIDHSTNSLQKNDIYSISRIEHEELNKKLQQSHKHIETLNLEIQRLTNLKQPSQLTRRRSITDQQKYNDLLSTFKKCLADMDLMKKEKRVLQDKLTEQLVLNEDMKTEKYKSALVRTI
ncbi:hypothetical protein BJ944DRAFT_76163 [Cunninghamella echinulata]|nr:hypothetical protein BJ944DRAFT_76163 [Cunninghamella echinulata]